MTATVQDRTAALPAVPLSASRARRDVWTTALGTLGSRVLGLLRDISTASLLGGGAAMDALVIAFRIPNLLRRILGEGALATAYIPVLAKTHAASEQQAWRLVSGLLQYLSGILLTLVALGELLCAACWLWLPSDSASRPLVSLTACLLPYLVFVCLWAQLAATLQTLGRFFAATASAAILNFVWLVAAWWLAPLWCATTMSRAYFLTAAILISGVLQVLALTFALRLAGFRWLEGNAETKTSLRQIVSATTPVAFGLAVTQLQTFLDGLTAWLLSANGLNGQPIAWLGGVINYPLQAGAAASIYLGERFYQFPLGLIGVSLATVAYPLMARHVAAKNYSALADDVMVGLRMVLALAVPCAVALVVLAEPLAQIGFAHGEFTSASAARAAGAIRAFGWGVPAFCMLPLIGRALNACEDRLALVRIGMHAMLLNLALNLVLVWPLAEGGLALATSISATVQVVALLRRFSCQHQRLNWSAIGSTLARVTVAGLLLALVLRGAVAIGGGFQERLPLRLTFTLLAGGAAYFLAALWILPWEIKMVMGSPGRRLR